MCNGGGWVRGDGDVGETEDGRRARSFEQGDVAASASVLGMAQSAEALQNRGRGEYSWE